MEPGTVVLSARPLAGARSSAMHCIEIEQDGRPVELVLRRFVNDKWLREEPDLARHEAARLMKAGEAGVPTPKLVAFDETGDGCGAPAVLMTRLRESVELEPGDVDRWLNGLAEAPIPVHEVPAQGHPWRYSPYVYLPTLRPSA